MMHMNPQKITTVSWIPTTVQFQFYFCSIISLSFVPFFLLGYPLCSCLFFPALISYYFSNQLIGNLKGEETPRKSKSTSTKYKTTNAST